MKVREWFRRKKEPREEVAVAPEPEVAQRFDTKRSPVQPPDIFPAVLNYIEDMLGDRRLVPSYLRTEMAAARKLPPEAWELARKDSEECPPELAPIRSAAVTHAMRVSTAVLRAQQDRWNL